MAVKPLASVQYDVEDLKDAIELYYRKGWTDGLPVVPPTEEEVRRFLEVAGREPDDVLGGYEELRRVVTAEKVAISAVMAGCLPEYFPVVLAIVEAMFLPGFELHGLANISTGGSDLGFIVNGPIRNKIGMNYRGNVMGPGNRANSTIGRAIRLLQINAMGAVPGAGFEEVLGRPVLDRSTMGQPGKYAGYHIVENEEDYPSLLPLHVELGFSREQSVVTIFTTSPGQQISVHAEHTADQIVETIAHYLVHTGRLTASGFCVVVIPPENVKYIVKDGWSKADVRKAIFERTTRTVAWVKEHGWRVGSMIDPRGGPVLPGDEKKTLAIASRPEDIYVVVAGGPAGGLVNFLLPYAGSSQSRVIRV